MSIIENIPLRYLALLTLALSLLFLWIGFLTGRRFAGKKTDAEDGSGVIITSQLTIVAFMIAFFFGIAASRFDLRRTVLLDESNSIGTTFLRTDFLPEPERSEARKLLKQYVDEYVTVFEENDRIKTALTETGRILDRLWIICASSLKQQPTNQGLSLLIQTLNETIDLHAKRVTVVIYQDLSANVWYTLYILAMLSMFATGYHTGMSKSHIGIPGLLLALTFTVMIISISDLDRARDGIFRISNEPFNELKKQIDGQVP